VGFPSTLPITLALVAHRHRATGMMLARGLQLRVLLLLLHLHLLHLQHLLLKLLRGWWPLLMPCITCGHAVGWVGQHGFRPNIRCTV